MPFKFSIPGEECYRQINYKKMSWKYINQIVEALAEDTKVIVFGKGCWFALNDMAKSKASALGVAWTCSARNGRFIYQVELSLYKEILTRVVCFLQFQPSKKWCVK